MTDKTKKVKCPECGEEIDTLDEITSYSKKSTLELSPEGDRLVVIEDSSLDEDDHYYECPECGGIIAEAQDEAITFLKGGE